MENMHASFRTQVPGSAEAACWQGLEGNTGNMNKQKGTFYLHNRTLLFNYRNTFTHA